MLPRLTHCRVHFQTLRTPVLYYIRTYADNAAPPDRRASAKLFQDAANEEAELAEQAARAHKVNALATKHENWDGEESMQDAVLRMLVDKYKPLRSGPIQTAEEKLKKSPPKIGVEFLLDFHPWRDGAVTLDDAVEEELFPRYEWVAFLCVLPERLASTGYFLKPALLTCPLRIVDV